MADDKYDPNGTIDEVKDYLERHPEKLQEVLDAEKAGKNRSTFVAELEERVAAVPQAAEPKPVTVAPSETRSFFGRDYTVEADGSHRQVR